MRPLEQPVPIANPNGALMYATHEAELPIPSLPLSAHRVYVVPELASSPLIAVAPLCDAGCTVTFANTTVTVHLGHDLLLMGSRDPTSGLWHVTLPPPAELAAATIDHQTGPADLVAFAHAALFSPALSTLHEALRLGYVTGIPGLTAETLRRHPPSSIATTKGHLDQTRMNLRSTKPSIPLPSADDTADCFPPPDTCHESTHQCFAAAFEPTGKIYTTTSPANSSPRRQQATITFSSSTTMTRMQFSPFP